MGFSDPVDLPEHGESGLVSVGIFEDLRYYWWVHSGQRYRTVEKTRFAPLKLDSPPPWFLVTVNLIKMKNPTKLASVLAIIAPQNGGYMKKAQHWG